MEAIAHGFRAPGLQSKLHELERRKAVLETEIAGAPAAAPRLHPSLAEVYRHKVATLQDAPADPVTLTEALEILRGLDHVEIKAAENGFAIELVGEIANMVKLSASAESLTKEPYRTEPKVSRNLPLTAATPVRIR
jgi:site-specific DNA recombinase